MRTIALLGLLLASVLLAGCAGSSSSTAGEEVPLQGNRIPNRPTAPEPPAK